jgi:CubicO group peptidase (beta-lactamase class C family)
MRAFVLFAGLVFAAVGVAPGGAENLSPEKTTFATAKMQALIGTAQGQAPAISVGVSLNGTPVFATGAGNASGGKPANETTGYQIGSLSKQLTAATMLALIEKKGGSTFSLDTKVVDTLPDSFPFSKSNQETIRHLLTQRTGYANYTHPPAGALNLPDGAAPIERQKLRGYVYTLLRSFPAPASPPPGSKHIYNNTNYYLASLMIEKLGGFADYRDAMKEYVFGPAEMTKSGFVGAPPTGITMALPPFDTTSSVVNKPHWPRGAGDVVSNVNDLLTWHAALMSDTLFSKASRATMFTPPGDGYAMGWAVAVTPPYVWLNHSGVIAGYSSFDGIFINANSKGWVSAVALASNDKVPVDLLVTCLAQLAMDPSPTLKGLGAGAKFACGISNKMFGP